MSTPGTRPRAPIRFPLPGRTPRKRTMGGRRAAITLGVAFACLAASACARPHVVWDCSAKSGLPARSETGDHRVDVVFVNRRAEPIDVVWFDFSGNESPRGRIAPGERMSMRSYLCHVRSFRDPSGAEVKRWRPLRRSPPPSSSPDETGGGGVQRIEKSTEPTPMLTAPTTRRQGRTARPESSRRACRPRTRR